MLSLVLLLELKTTFRLDCYIHICIISWSSGSVEDKCDVKTKPFRRMENCLFSCFTTCVPWCVMRKIYWN